VAGNHCPVDRYEGTWIYKDGVAYSKLIGRYFPDCAIVANDRRTRQISQQVANSFASPRDRQMLENLGG
jgi:hypothetical protein